MFRLSRPAVLPKAGRSVLPGITAGHKRIVRHLFFFLSAKIRLLSQLSKNNYQKVTKEDELPHRAVLTGVCPPVTSNYGARVVKFCQAARLLSLFTRKWLVIMKLFTLSPEKNSESLGGSVFSS